MKYAFNPREWDDAWFWIAEDLLTLSTHRFVPEEFQHNGVTYEKHKVYMPQGKSLVEGLEVLAEDIRAHLVVEVRDYHAQRLIVTYAQVMQELARMGRIEVYK